MSARPRGIVVGLGVMGGYHLRVLRQHPDAELVALVDPAHERREAASDGSALPTFESLDQALSEVEADFACIAAPARFLPQLALEALRADLAVLVEKPMGVVEEDAARVVTEAAERNLLLAAGLVERCNPAVIALRAKLEAGEGGRIYQVHARRLSPYPGRESPTGVALDLATHDVDVIRFVCDSEVQRVYAETAEREPRGREDLLSASLRLDSGTTGVLEVNWLTPTKVRQLSVTCEAGMFVVDYLTQDLTYFAHPRTDIEWDTLRMMRGTGEGDMVRYGIARREPLVVQWDRFLAALRSEGVPAATGADGLAALSIGRAIQRSGAEHAPVAPSYRQVLST